VSEVIVQDDWLFLTDGQGWRFGRYAAAPEIRPRSRALGGDGIRTRLEPRVDTLGLSEEIARALCSSRLHPSDVEVTAEGGRVRLTGYVNSVDDRALADSAAWAAPGATLVENDLVVGLEP